MDPCRHGVRLHFFCVKCHQDSEHFRQRLEEVGQELQGRPPKPSYDEVLYQREFAL